ncbi:hypothetical protein [Cellulomonas humilata]|uniref:Uncharacterized protein n=1 Tax=Cellulomonas humilata TaxID=144055 RepID=A0ABU0EF79_9CELL|nr:hypothetical protein [Cellulomonas humilata]MDQ0373748.1 hypothetical protein [Cellulomonas humilata]
MRRLAAEPTSTPPSVRVRRSFDAQSASPGGPQSTPVPQPSAPVRRSPGSAPDLARSIAPADSPATPITRSAAPAARSSDPEKHLGRSVAPTTGTVAPVTRAAAPRPVDTAPPTSAAVPRVSRDVIPTRTLASTPPTRPAASAPSSAATPVTRSFDADVARSAATPSRQPVAPVDTTSSPSPAAPVAYRSVALDAPAERMRSLPVATPADPSTSVRRAPVRTAGRLPLGLGWPPSAAEPGSTPAAPADAAVTRVIAPDGPTNDVPRTVLRTPTSSTPAPEPTADTATDPFDAGAVAVAAGIARRVDPTEVRFPAPGQSMPMPVARAATAVAERAPEPAPAQQAGEVVAAGPAAPPAQDLGALADELWERLELRLRTDLMLERERRGTWPDA